MNSLEDAAPTGAIDVDPKGVMICNEVAVRRSTSAQDNMMLGLSNN
jgi:hypothetical protein